MTLSQAISLAVLLLVVAALIQGKVRADVVALSGAAVLLATGTLRPAEVQGAFASPAIIALASLFVIAYAMEISGLLDLMIRMGGRLCARIGAAGIWIMIVFCGAASAFLNNTPIVVLAAPVVRDVSRSIGASPRRFLMPLSYVTVLGGCCTLIGTSTNLLVNDMARSGGQPAFGLFEITGPALVVAAVGGLYLLLFGARLMGQDPGGEDVTMEAALKTSEARHADVSVGDPRLFAGHRPFQPRKALAALAVFVGVVAVAAANLAPIAAAAFTGAVVLILLRIITAEEAYSGMRPEILLLIAGMVVIGIALDVTGLAAASTDALIGVTRDLSPFWALVLLYGGTLFLTEALSNATVAVLITPVAVALAESLGVSPRPFLVAVMIAASAAFATPFGYQTNVLVYEMGRYSYMDFVRVGLPLNLITWAAAVLAIPVFFPF